MSLDQLKAFPPRLQDGAALRRSVLAAASAGDVDQIAANQHSCADITQH